MIAPDGGATQALDMRPLCPWHLGAREKGALDRAVRGGSGFPVESAQPSASLPSHVPQHFLLLPQPLASAHSSWFLSVAFEKCLNNLFF